MREIHSPPLVSIIISTYNRSRLLPEAIESVLAQTYPSVELIVVDDGSTDDTPAVAARYGSRIHYIRQKNAGVSIARNRGFSASQGEFVGFLDDDDVYFKDKVALQVAALLEHPESPAANCNFYHMMQDGALHSHNGIIPARDTHHTLLLGNFIWMSGPLMRREALLAAGLFAPEMSLAADLDMWLRLSRLNDFVTIQKPLGAYRIQAGSMVTKADLAEQDCMAALSRAHNHLADTPANRKLKARSEAQWRLWFGANYLYAGKPECFERNYRRANELAPEMFRDEKFMTRRIAQDALNFRSPNSDAFCAAFFSNLPTELDFVRAYREHVEQHIVLAQALDEIANRDVGCGMELMKQALQLHPDMRNHPDMVREWLFEPAMCSREGAAVYLDRIRAGLPEDEPFLMRVVNEVKQDTSVWEGYLAYQQGEHGKARNKMLSGMVHRPSWLMNRGIVKVFMHSMLTSPRALAAAILL